MRIDPQVLAAYGQLRLPVQFPESHGQSANAAGSEAFNRKIPGAKGHASEHGGVRNSKGMHPGQSGSPAESSPCSPSMGDFGDELLLCTNNPSSGHRSGIAKDHGDPPGGGTKSFGNSGSGTVLFDIQSSGEGGVTATGGHASPEVIGTSSEAPENKITSKMLAFQIAAVQALVQERRRTQAEPPINSWMDAVTQAAATTCGQWPEDGELAQRLKHDVQEETVRLVIYLQEKVTNVVKRVQKRAAYIRSLDSYKRRVDEGNASDLDVYLFKSKSTLFELCLELVSGVNPEGCGLDFAGMAEMCMSRLLAERNARKSRVTAGIAAKLQDMLARGSAGGGGGGSSEGGGPLGLGVVPPGGSHVHGDQGGGGGVESHFDMGGRRSTSSGGEQGQQQHKLEGGLAPELGVTAGGSSHLGGDHHHVHPGAHHLSVPGGGGDGHGLVQFVASQQQALCTEVANMQHLLGRMQDLHQHGMDLRLDHICLATTAGAMAPPGTDSQRAELASTYVARRYDEMQMRLRELDRERVALRSEHESCVARMRAAGAGAGGRGTPGMSMPPLSGLSAIGTYAPYMQQVGSSEAFLPGGTGMAGMGDHQSAAAPRDTRGSDGGSVALGLGSDDMVRGAGAGGAASVAAAAAAALGGPEGDTMLRSSLEARAAQRQQMQGQMEREDSDLERHLRMQRVRHSSTSAAAGDGIIGELDGGLGLEQQQGGGGGGGKRRRMDAGHAGQQQY